MKKQVKKFIDFIKKAKNVSKSLLKQSMICKYYYKKPLNGNAILVESRNGRGLGENIIQILKELSKPEYSRFKVFFSTAKKNTEDIPIKFKLYNIKYAAIVETHSLRYFKLLETSKYLINDVTFPYSFVKRKGQIYLNTWHGMPLKGLGRNNKSEIYDMGNSQRNFLLSDYVVCTGSSMTDRFSKAYELKNLYTGKFLCTGYPRNDIFFNHFSGQSVREAINIADKQVLAYMPTWRGFASKVESKGQINKIKKYLNEIDVSLNDNQILFINLHLLVQSSLDFTLYKNIRPFPDKFTIYETLNACDCLITDYSSVMYDYALTRKKIILFVYDREEYDDNRGLYTPLDELPFPKVESAEELIDEINSKETADYSQLIQECCGFEKGTAATDICRYILLNQGAPELRAAENNGKENVLVFGGSLLKNGVTSALLSLYNNIDLNRRNYMHCFYRSHFLKNKDFILKIPENIPLIGLSTQSNPTFWEKISLMKLVRNMKLGKNDKKLLERLYKREWRKHFGEVKFSYALDFDGYTYYNTLLFQYFEGKRWIWLHNNIVDEIKTRNNIKRSIAIKAYSEYDCALNVSHDILEINKSLTNNQGEKMIELRNFVDYGNIINRSVEKLQYDDDTYYSHSIKKLNEILSDDKIKVFITIGRYSSEKGHDRLINAFEEFSKAYSETYLIILGGHGPLFMETLRYARQSGASSKIVILRSINNPMPLLAKCDLFILSSFYEGLPVALQEADSLGIPVIATKVAGTSCFMEENGGYLCENSEEGILQGMRDFMDGKVKPMGIDFGEYNSKINQKFEELMEK